MSSVVLVLLASMSCAFSFPRIATYNERNAALRYFNPQQYSYDPKSYSEDWQKFDNLVNQRNAIQSQISKSHSPNEVAVPSPSSDGLWVWVRGIQNTQTSYSGADIRGLNAHQGTNPGPSNYNGFFSRASSTIDSPKKQPVLVQGAVSNVGDSGSIYVPGN